MKQKRISQFIRNEKLKKKILANLKKIRKHNYPFRHLKIAKKNLPECTNLILSLQEQVNSRKEIKIHEINLNKVNTKELSGLNSHLESLLDSGKRKQKIQEEMKKMTENTKNKKLEKQNLKKGLLSPDLPEKIGNLANRPKSEVKE